MNPRRFGKIGDMHPLYLAVKFKHVFFKFGIVAELVAPEQISLPVVINENGGVDTHPAVVGALAIGHGDKRLAYGILERALRSIADSHAYAGAVGADKVIIPAVALYTLGRI